MLLLHLVCCPSCTNSGSGIVMSVTQASAWLDFPDLPMPAKASVACHPRHSRRHRPFGAGAQTRKSHTARSHRVDVRPGYDDLQCVRALRRHVEGGLLPDDRAFGARARPRRDYIATAATRRSTTAPFSAHSTWCSNGLLTERDPPRLALGVQEGHDGPAAARGVEALPREGRRQITRRCGGVRVVGCSDRVRRTTPFVVLTEHRFRCHRNRRRRETGERCLLAHGPPTRVVDDETSPRAARCESRPRRRTRTIAAGTRASPRADTADIAVRDATHARRQDQLVKRDVGGHRRPHRSEVGVVVARDWRRLAVERA